MELHDKTKEQLIEELGELRKNIIELEKEKTEIKRVKKQLIHSRDLMDYIIAHARSAIAVHDKNMNYIYVSERYLKDFKVKEQNVIGKHHYEVFPDLPQKWRDVHQKALAGEVSSAEEDPFVREDGSVDWTRWECRPWYESDGSIGGLIIYTEVITERKQAEEALRNEKGFTETALNAQQDTFFLFETATGRAIRWNQAFNDITGYTDEEISRMPAPDSYYSTEDLERAAIFMAEVLETGIGKVELELICKDGRKVPFEYNVSLIKEEAGSAKYIISIGRDVTERRKLEEERQTMQKLESIGILAGGIAHDFNNLLTGISNNIYLSKMRIDRESKEYKSLESAEKAIHRATNLTQQLLTFSRGGLPIKRTASIIETIKESAEFAMRGSHVKCEYIVADELWPVEVDEGQINQVMLNLILNASQAMPAGGTIRVSIDNIKLTPDTELILQEGRYLKIVIQDEGTGISEEHLKNIFDPYFTTKGMGRGLGLSITYSIIKNHDGHISVESQMGVGTTFTIYLPASEKQIEAKESVEDTHVVGQGKVLIMDDEEIIRKSIGACLTMSGYEIEYAEEGNKAVDLYQKAMETSKPFDAVILDLTVRGGMGGKEAIKKLREIDPGIKAIVSSGYSNDAVMANFREYGFRDVLTKPLRNPGKMSEILHNVINE